ncbi:MAG: hypothetical protein ACYC65_13235 [Candidatus Limnocylindrales bacterium]
MAGAASLAFFVLAGSDLTLPWITIALFSVFSFVESVQLQALLADVTPRPIRDAAYSTYFALAFGVGSLWGIAYGAVVGDRVRGSCGHGRTGERGLGLVFWLMAGASILAALATLRVWVPPRGETLAI